MSGDLIKSIDARIAEKFKRQYAKLSVDALIVLAFLKKRIGIAKSESL